MNVGILIADSGPSVPPDLLPRFFDESSQEPALPNDAPIRPGSAGYFLAREIAEAHGGTYTLESAPDAGLRVAMMLPGWPCPSSLPV